MLEQAIIDAKALRESALKNAENMIIEKYSDQIQQAVNQLLEQDEFDMDSDQEEESPVLDDIPLSTAEDLPGEEGPDSEDDIITLDLPGLAKQVKQKEEELGIDLEAGESHEELAADLGDAAEAAPEMDSTMAESEEEELGEGKKGKIPKGLADYMAKKNNGSSDDKADKDDDKEKSSGKDGKMPMKDEPEGEDLNKDGKKGHGKVPAFLDEEDEKEDLDEEYEISDSIVDAILERLKVDIEPQKGGWMNTPESVMQEYEDMVLAMEADDEVKEENEALRARVKELEESIKTANAKSKKLVEENSKFKDAFAVLKEKVNVVNLSNAKLLYINQTLEHPSLNERQKEKIVEAISKAETPKEAKVMFETLQSTVGSTSDRKLPESLSEAVSNNSSMILSSRRKQNNNTKDVFSERMKLLAGIKK